MGLISRVSSRTYSFRGVTIMRFNAFTWQALRRQYMTKARETHLKRVGMDRDNFLHDQKQGFGVWMCFGVWALLFGIYTPFWRHCQYEEMKYVRLPIEERGRDPNWAVICMRMKHNFGGIWTRNPFHVLSYPLSETQQKYTNEYGKNARRGVEDCEMETPYKAYRSKI